MIICYKHFVDLVSLSNLTKLLTMTQAYPLQELPTSIIEQNLCDGTGWDALGEASRAANQTKLHNYVFNAFLSP